MTGQPQPPPDPVVRFAADCADIAFPLGLAVSGGPDSMALLVLAAAAFPGRVAAATVDHRLRVESAGEAAMVAAECARLGVPHATLVPDAAIAGASLQARARAARYGLLARWATEAGVAAIATAHHADDQAETFLMRAARGSGVAGLAGIRVRATIAGAAVVRPLLDWRRAELRAIVRRAGVPFVDDPANADSRHDRTRFRRLLEANEWLDPPNLARAAAHLAETDADLGAMSDWLWGTRAAPDGAEVLLDGADLPREVARRLIRRAVAHVVAAAGLAPWNDGANVETLLDALVSGASATRAGVHGSVRRGQWRFRPAPVRKHR